MLGLILTIIFNYAAPNNDLIRFKGFLEGQGPVIIALFSSESSFLNSEMADTNWTIQADQLANYSSIPIQKGEYALAVFQDLNQNQILDKNWLGIPTEPFGFSMNPTLIFGPPSYKQCKINQGNNGIVIELKIW